MHMFFAQCFGCFYRNSWATAPSVVHFCLFSYQYSVQKTSIIQISENISQIRSTVADGEALSGGFKAIKNVELFKLNINRIYRIILLYTVTFAQ